jgi:hypothetical protein
MYPVLNIESAIIHATNLYRFLDAAARNGIQADNSTAEGLKDLNSNILKMVLANALTVEGSGQSELGNRLFESVKESADDIMRSESVDVRSLPLLALVVSGNSILLCQDVTNLTLPPHISGDDLNTTDS